MLPTPRFARDIANPTAGAAEKVGIMVKDQIVSVNGVEVSRKSHTACAFEEKLPWHGQPPGFSPHRLIPHKLRCVDGQHPPPNTTPHHPPSPHPLSPAIAPNRRCHH